MFFLESGTVLESIMPEQEVEEESDDSDVNSSDDDHMDNPSFKGVIASPLSFRRDTSHASTPWGKLNENGMKCLPQNSVEVEESPDDAEGKVERVEPVSNMEAEADSSKFKVIEKTVSSVGSSLCDVGFVFGMKQACFALLPSLHPQ